MHKSPIKKATWLSPMLGLARSPLSAGEGPAVLIHPMAFAFPFCPTGSLCKAALRILRARGPENPALSLTSKPRPRQWRALDASSPFFEKTNGQFL